MIIIILTIALIGACLHSPAESATEKQGDVQGGSGIVGFNWDGGGLAIT